MITFIPRDAQLARSNLDAFIEKYRPCGAWGLGRHPFGDDAWPLKGVEGKGRSGFGYFARRGYNAGKHQTKRGRPAVIPDEFRMPPLFRDFAKAMLAYGHLTRATKGIRKYTAVLPYLLEALGRSGCESDPDPTEISIAELDATCELLRESGLAKTTVALWGSALATIWNRMVGLELVQMPAPWSSPFDFKGTDDHLKLGPKFEALRHKKLPDPWALEACAAMFQRDDLDWRATFVSSYVALAMCAPERSVEFLSAPAELLDPWTDPETLEEGVTLRWFPAKGGAPQTKNVDILMSQVARRAHQRLYELSAPARKLACWYEDNPTMMYLPPHLEYLRDKPFIDLYEARAALYGGEVIVKAGYEKRTLGANTRNFLKRNQVSVTRRAAGVRGGCKPLILAFADLEKAVLRQLPEGFPIMDAQTGMKYSEALCLLRQNEFATGWNTGPMPAILQPVSRAMIYSALGNGEEYASIFVQYGYTGHNGVPLKLRSHQMRHYLNTIVRRNSHGQSKLTEEEIALWSGRKEVNQNRTYNHQSASDTMHELEERLGFHSDTTPFGDISKRVFVRRNQFGQIEKITAHLTDIGYCLHDYIQSPCPIAKNCIQCAESLCIKGCEHSRKALDMLYADSRALTQAAQCDAEAGVQGADEWFKAHLEREGLLRNLLDILDKSDVPEGTPIMLNVQTPNRIKEALARRPIPIKPVAATIQILSDVTQLLSAPANEGKEAHNAT